MVNLTGRQTKALERLFKKVEIEYIAFDNGDEKDTILVYVQFAKTTTKRMIVMGENGAAKFIADVPIEVPT